MVAYEYTYQDHKT